MLPPVSALLSLHAIDIGRCFYWCRRISEPMIPKMEYHLYVTMIPMPLGNWFHRAIGEQNKNIKMSPNEMKPRNNNKKYRTEWILDDGDVMELPAFKVDSQYAILCWYSCDSSWLTDWSHNKINTTILLNKFQAINSLEIPNLQY